MTDLMGILDPLYHDRFHAADWHEGLDEVDVDVRCFSPENRKEMRGV